MQSWLKYIKQKLHINTTQVYDLLAVMTEVTNFKTKSVSKEAHLQKPILWTDMQSKQVFILYFGLIVAG